MITFLLNDQQVRTDMPAGTVLLDFIRYHRHLTGTKVGCREGDCGACMVLVGEARSEGLQYRSFTSCLTPLANVQGRHVVTVEGLNLQGLSFIQEAMVAESATQCGFCTPGFVVSLAGFCLSRQDPTRERALAAIEGNICRCTGYKSIERAAARVVDLLQQRQDQEPARFAAERQLLPAYFLHIRDRLQALALPADGHALPEGAAALAGGGTDLYVQQPEAMQAAAAGWLFNHPDLKGIGQSGHRCVIGAAATVTDLGESDLIRALFPGWPRYQRLVSSTPIRNMATLAGNFVNASPIGDLTIMFLALDARLVLSDGRHTREVPLRQFYKGYKQLDKGPQEFIRQVWFELPGPGWRFNFEKVSKRTHLDIASVNSAMALRLQQGRLRDVSLSAGGLGPIPLYLARTSAFLEGKAPRESVFGQALDIAQTEISPITDARGSAAYKRLLLNQLLKAHFLDARR